MCSTVITIAYTGHFNHVIGNGTSSPRCFLGSTEGTVVAVTPNVTSCAFHGGPVRLRPDRTAAGAVALPSGLKGVSLEAVEGERPKVLVFVGSPRRLGHERHRDNILLYIYIYIIYLNHIIKNNNNLVYRTYRQSNDINCGVLRSRIRR